MDYKYFLSTLTEHERLKAPKNIFSEGSFSLLMEGRRVSVVGSRKASLEGLKRCEIVCRELVNNAITVVSGLAAGIDTMAHETAIKQGGKTIAVLGTPLSKAYPASNKDLLNYIKQYHLAISQFSENERVYPGNFPTRNKTMALISDATIIVEASENSGTKHQGWEALRLGRELFIMESVVSNSSLTWPKKMLEYGATVLTRNNIQSLLDHLHSNRLDLEPSW
jgi:DNA processing protein